MSTLLDRLLRRTGRVGAPPFGHTPSPNYRWADLGGVVIYGINASGDPREVSATDPLKISAQAAQAITGTLQTAQGANANGSPLAVSGMGVCAFEVTGNGVGTITFQALPIGGTTWVSLPAQQRGTGLIASTATTTGVYLAEIHGMQQVRAVTSGMGSGSFTVIASAVPGTFYGHITVPAVYAGTPAAYRTNITAADLIPNPGTVTGSAVAGGACTANNYNLIIVAKNAYGRTLGSTKITVTTSGSNLTVRGAFAAVAGATSYDVYCDLSTDPHWVGEITETQRGTGTVITVAGTATANCTTAAGGVAGAVDIQVPAGSTMPQSGTTAAQSTAYLIPSLVSAVDCTGKSQVRFNCTFSRSGDGASLAATVAPAFYDESDQTWYLGDPKNFIFGGTAGAYNSLKQALVFDVRGAKAHLVLLSISGTGARFDANAVTS